MAKDAKTQPKKLWRVVLVLSLALNLAIVGIVAGFGLRSAGGRPPQSFEIGLGPLGQALTKEQRREIAEELRGRPDVRDAGRTAQRQVLAQISEILRAEPFDPAALEDALSHANQRISTVQDAARVAFAAQVETMSPQERATFADRLDEIATRRRRR